MKKPFTLFSGYIPYRFPQIMAVLFLTICTINNITAQHFCTIQQPEAETVFFRKALHNVNGFYAAPLPVINTIRVHKTTKTGVYICRSEHAYAYHRYSCRGLGNCRAEVSRVSVSDAQRLGYRPCRICY